MTNELFRKHAITLVQTALMKGRDAHGIDHPGLRGRIREIAVEHLFRPFLPGQFEIGTGKIVDADGNQSAETDLIIYSRHVLPPMLYSDRDGLFPIEASFYAIEVKSKTTSAEIAEAIRKAERLRLLQPRWRDNQFSGKVAWIVPALFGFDSDLTVTGKSEIERYSEIDPQWRSDPRIKAICVAGRGYWWWHGARDQCWEFHPATEHGDEVIDFLSGVMNTMPDALLTRGQPYLGTYLISKREVIVL